MPATTPPTPAAQRPGRGHHPAGQPGRRPADDPGRPDLDRAPDPAPAPGGALLQAQALRVVHRGRPDVVALAGVDLEVRAGEVVALCGPNGAGKTTLLDAATGTVRSAGGRLTVLGACPERLDAQGRAAVGVALADLGLPPAARARRLLEHHAGLYRRPHDPGELAERLGLAAHWHRSVRRLSTGQRQRLAVAVAVVGRPRLLLLDEPTAALDPAGRRAVLDLLRECVTGGAGVLWSSHTLSDVERSADRVVVLDRGRVLRDGPPHDVAGGDVVRFGAPPGTPLDSLVAALPAGAGVLETAPGAFEVSGSDLAGADAPQLLATVAAWQAAHGAAQGLTLGPRSLEELVLALSSAADRSGTVTR